MMAGRAMAIGGWYCGRREVGRTTTFLHALMGILAFIYTLSFLLSIALSPTPIKHTTPLHFHGESVGRGHDGTDYTLWSKKDTYFDTCQRRYLGNYTWGKPLTKFVDKAEAKNIVKAMNIDGLKIAKTLALYNNETMSSEFTLEEMRRFPMPYIIKPTHASGSVLRVKNGMVFCIKKCKGFKDTTIGEEALGQIQHYAKQQLDIDFSKQSGEMQYKDVPRQIMIEEDISNESKFDVSKWFFVNARPLFAGIQCSPTVGEIAYVQDRAFVNLNFQQLDIREEGGNLPWAFNCSAVRPHNFDKQVEIATALAKSVPGNHVLRVDFYPSENNVIFSEFTFTRSSCKHMYALRPRVAEGLLHAVQQGVINPAMATPDLVESIIHDTSWVFLDPSIYGRMVASTARAFPSPVDLCEHANKKRLKYAHPKWQSDIGVKDCLEETKKVASSTLRCVVSSGMSVFSDEKRPTFRVVLGHVAWGRGLTLLFITVILTWMDLGTKRRKNQYFNNILYYLAVLVVMRITLPNVESTFSHHSIIDTAKQSFEAFAYVHPMDSPHIALCHFATYWFAIASWISKSPRDLLLWQFLYETVTFGVNEYSHIIENQNVVHCTRVAFKAIMNKYALDDWIRAYILPPFLVYGYLLPKFTIYWIRKVPVLSWIGALIILGIYKINVAKGLGGRKYFQVRSFLDRQHKGENVSQ
ncbi:hypothetical protein ACHAWF_004394 [Thalassiosira exigua]